MKKITIKLIGAIFVAILCLIFGSTTGLAASNPIVLKIAHQRFPPQAFLCTTTGHWAKLIKERTNGDVELKFFYDTLAKGPGILTAAQQGVADGFTCMSSFFTGRMGALTVLEVYVNAAPDRYLEVVNAIRPVMDKIYVQQNIKYCGSIFNYRGTSYSHRNRHFHKPDDFKGQKIRLPGLWGQKLLKMYGASPTMILPPELYTSAQTGIIDGVATINMLIDVFKLYEVLKYITEFPNSSSAFIQFGLNMNTFNKLDKKYQGIILQAAKEAEAFSWDYGRKEEDELRKKLEKLTNYYVLTPEEYKVFLKYGWKVVPELRKHSGPLGQELMDVIQKVKNQ